MLLAIVFFHRSHTPILAMVGDSRFELAASYFFEWVEGSCVNIHTEVSVSRAEKQVEVFELSAM